MDIENFIKDLTPEQQGEAGARTTVDEPISYTKTEGINLDESDLDAITLNFSCTLAGLTSHSALTYYNEELRSLT